MKMQMHHINVNKKQWKKISAIKLCSKDKQRSYGLGTTWGWIINGI